MDYKDLFICLDHDADGPTLSLRSANLGLQTAEEKLEFDFPTLLERLRRIEQCLLCMFHPERRDEADWRQQLEDDFYAMGVELHEALKRGEVGEEFFKKLGHIDSDPGLGLRLRVLSDPSKKPLHAIASAPWEALCDKKEGPSGFLGRRRRFPISRYFPGGGTIRPLGVEGPLKVLLVPAVPEGPEPVATEEEMQAICDVLEEVPGIRPERGPSTLQEVRDQVMDDGFHVVHFIGHGGFDKNMGTTWVTFEGEDRQPARWRGDLLANRLIDLPTLRLVVLSNCYGATLVRHKNHDAYKTVAPALMRANIPALVAMQFPISDGAAIAFSRRFYARLAKHDPIDVAVSEARLSIDDLDETPETRIQWPLPAVFTRVEDGRLTKPGDGEKPAGLRTGGNGQSPSYKETLKIGIRSFATGYGEGLEERVHSFLGLEDRFDGRAVRDPQDWNGEVIRRLESFTGDFVTERRRLEIDFAALWSIAFTTGYFLEAKSGLDLTLVQRSQDGTRVFFFRQDGKLPEGELWRFDEHEIGRGEELAVAISVTRPVLAHALKYLQGEDAPRVGRLLHATVPKTGQKAVLGGEHALLLAQELDHAITNREFSEWGKPVHVLGSVPNSLAFFLGQLSPGWSDTQLYEYAFNQPRNFGKYTPSILLPPRG